MKNWSSLAALAAGLLLAAGCTSGTTTTTVQATSSSAAPAPSSSEPQGAPDTTAGEELTEVDLESNITVFFRPERIDGQVQAEETLRAMIGDQTVDSTVVVGRLDAWAIATDLAGRVANPVDLEPQWQQSLGEVARVVVADRDVRNRLTDSFEDSPDVAAVAYVVGVRVAGAEATDLRPVWELLGYVWAAD